MTTSNTNMNTDYRVHNFYDLPEVLRLVDSRDNSSEILNRDAAFSIMDESNLDLILMTEKAEPPVYQLIDYGKWKYERDRQNKQKRKKDRENNRGVKEIQFNFGIGDHDYNVRLKQILKHIVTDDVKITIRASYTNRSRLPRGMTIDQYAKSPDFVLFRVISDLGDAVKPDNMVTGDHNISILLRKGD